MSYDDAVATVAALPSTAELRYALGFWLTASTGYWFLDIDIRKCNLGEYQATDFANGLVRSYGGAFLEWSSSRKGLHIIGRGAVPPH